VKRGAPTLKPAANSGGSTLTTKRGVTRDKYARHSAAAELLLNGVCVAECGLYIVAQIRHAGMLLE